MDALPTPYSVPGYASPSLEQTHTHTHTHTRIFKEKAKPGQGSKPQVFGGSETPTHPSPPPPPRHIFMQSCGTRMETFQQPLRDLVDMEGGLVYIRQSHKCFYRVKVRRREESRYRNIVFQKCSFKSLITDPKRASPPQS